MRSGSVLSNGSAEADWSSIATLASPAVVRVKVTACTGSGYGSGFFIDDTTILSNRHVVTDSTSLEIDAPSDLGMALGATTVAGGTDLGVITARYSGEASLELAPEDPVPGDRVFVAGYPGGGALTFTGGRVIEVVDGERDEVEGKVIYSDVLVQPGNSGGPMLNARGQVVGVVMAIEMDHGYAMAVPVSTVRAALVGPRPGVIASCVD